MITAVLAAVGVAFAGIVAYEFGAFFIPVAEAARHAVERPEAESPKALTASGFSDQALELQGAQDAGCGLCVMQRSAAAVSA